MHITSDGVQISANNNQKNVFLCSPDDWQFYPAYFDSLFHLVDQSWSPPEEGEQ